MREKRNRGSVILVSVGVLALLTIYAIIFFSSMSVERRASSKFVMEVKAENIAVSGAERITALVKNYMLYKDGVVGTYQDRNYDKVDSEWRYPQASIDDNRSLEEIAEPGQLSFPSSAKIFTTKTGKKIAYSGSTGNTLPGGKDLYRAKVLDCSSMIYINSLNAVNLKRILKNLFGSGGLRIASSDAVAVGLVDGRPDDGYKTKLQIQMKLREVVGSESAGDSIFRQIRDFITCYAWVDDSQIRPLKAQKISAKGKTDGCVGKKDKRHEHAIVFEPRAPININTASKAVLYAVLKDLKGGGVTISGKVAGEIAQAIIDQRGKSEPHAGAIVKHNDTYFTSMTQFYTWCKKIFYSKPLEFKPPEAYADLLMANFNPNVDISKFHPDKNIVRSIDKTDLEFYSTEFCFNSMGFFEITSLGMMLDSAGRIQSSAKIQTVTRLFNIYRDTTQNDFESDRKALNYRGRHLGIISTPEYSNARQFWTAADGLKELRPINKMCEWDGQLIVNGLVRKMVLNNDFLMGFVRNEQMSNGTYIGTLKGILYPNIVMFPNASTDGNPGVKNQAGDETLFNPRATQDEEQVIHRDFFRGSDLAPLGVIIDGTRRKYFSFSGSNMPQSKGTIEFWIKPNKASAYLAEGDKEYYFYWNYVGSTSVDSPINADQPSIAIWREKGNGVRNNTYIKAHFLLGWQAGLLSSSPPPGLNMTSEQYIANYNNTIMSQETIHPFGHDGLTIKKDVSDWKAGEWHHVTVVFGYFTYGGKTAIVNGHTVYKDVYYGSEGRLYVDGHIADHVAPFATTGSGGSARPMSYGSNDETGGFISSASATFTYPLQLRVDELDGTGNPIITQQATGNFYPAKQKKNADGTDAFTSVTTSTKVQKKNADGTPAVDSNGNAIYVTQSTTKQVPVMLPPVPIMEPVNQTEDIWVDAGPFGSPHLFKVGENYTLDDGRMGQILDTKDVISGNATGVKIQADWQKGNFYIGCYPDTGGVMANFANGIMDNIQVHRYIHQQIRDNRNSFDPTPRYTRPNDSSYPSYGTRFRKRLYPLEKQDITLGNVYWTVYPSDTGGMATVTMERDGTSLPISANQDNKEGLGYSLQGKTVLANQRLYYYVDLDNTTGGYSAGGYADGLSKLNTSPIFDDVTITYFTQPEVLAYYRFND